MFKVCHVHVNGCLDSKEWLFIYWLINARSSSQEICKEWVCLSCGVVIQDCEECAYTLIGEGTVLSRHMNAWLIGYRGSIRWELWFFGLSSDVPQMRKLCALRWLLYPSDRNREYEIAYLFGLTNHLERIGVLFAVVVVRWGCEIQNIVEVW